MDAATQLEAHSQIMWVAPAAATALSQTHAALVTSNSVLTSDVNFRGTTRTVKQLRVNNPPNAWEVPWLIWNFTDNTHFYYLVLKPGGWELGKADPAYPGAQRFLATGSEAKFPVGNWSNFEIVHNQVGKWSVNFLGYGSGGIRGLATPGATVAPPVNTTPPISTVSPFPRKKRGG